jgi:hypothetical protein
MPEHGHASTGSRWLAVLASGWAGTLCLSPVASLPVHITFTKHPDLGRERRQVGVASQSMFRRMWIFAAALLIFACWEFIDGSTSRGVSLAVVGVLVAVNPWIAIAIYLRKNRAGFGHDMRVDIADDVVSVETPSMLNRISWSAITRVDERRGFFVGYAGKRVQLALPVECMSADEVEELRAFVVSRGKAPALKGS